MRRKDVKIKMIPKLILLTVVLIVLLLFWYFRPRYVKLELVTSIQSSNISVNDDKTDFRLELHWWFIDAYPDLNVKGMISHVSPEPDMLITNVESLNEWGVDFNKLGINFDESNVILAFSREIKEMKFNRGDVFPYKAISTVKTIMSKEFEPNTIYVYKIPKYEVREDLRAYTETSVEK